MACPCSWFPGRRAKGAPTYPRCCPAPLMLYKKKLRSLAPQMGVYTSLSLPLSVGHYCPATPPLPAGNPTTHSFFFKKMGKFPFCFILFLFILFFIFGLHSNWFGFGPITYWLFVWACWIELDILFPLVIYIINVGLLIGYLFGLIELGLRYYFLWPCVLLMWAC